MPELEAFISHLNMTRDEVSEVGDVALARILTAAVAFTESQLGYRLNSAVEFPMGVPADVTHAVYMLAAHWFAQREATVVGVTMMGAPLGFDDVIRSHRSYTFG